MQSTHKANKLKQFSKKVFEFTRHYGFLNVGESENNVKKDFSSCRLFVISISEIEKHGAIDYIFGLDNIYLLQYANSDDTYCAYIKYLQNPNVICVEPDKVIRLINPSLLKQPRLSLYEANTKHSWGYDYINTEAALNYILQNKNIDELPEIVVGIIDDGVDFNNPIISRRLLASHSFIYNSPKSTIEHGTRISSILIENTLENVKIISYKIFSERETTLSLLRLAEFHAELDGVDIVNTSFGTPYKFDATIKTPLQIASAGNTKTNVPHYPAACEGVVSVTGITEKSVLCNISPYGDWVQVAAPSEDIKLPDIYGLSAYGELNGTSYGAAFVTAICAMIKTQHPDLSNEQIKQALFNSCTKADMPVKHGIVNMYNAVTYFDENVMPIEKGDTATI